MELKYAIKYAKGGNETMSFGSILKELRTEQDVYQKELAFHLNVSIGTISNYEKDRHFPDPEALCKIADFFEVSTDYLLERTKFRHNPDLLCRPLTDKYTLSDFINSTLDLSPQHKADLTRYAELLKLSEQTSSGE